MQVIMIVAADRNGLIGVDGKLPWHYSEDLKRFKKLTTGHTVIMGRKTYESIGKPLPDRRNIVISRDVDRLRWQQHCWRINDIEAALEFAYKTGETKCFIIGGAEIYKAAMEFACELYLTRVPDQTVPEGSKVAYFDYQSDDWDVSEIEQQGELVFYKFKRAMVPSEKNMKFEEIKRYNQGFYGFGPLEQCSEGRLMKVSDVEVFVKNQDAANRKHMATLWSKVDEEKNGRREAEDEVYALENELGDLLATNKSLRRESITNHWSDDLAGFFLGMLTFGLLREAAEKLL